MLFLLGMHRSGTSAVAGVLRLLGVDPGGPLLNATADNPRGYFEHTRLVSINERILESLGLYWDATVPLPQGWLDDARVQALRREAVTWLSEEFEGVGLFQLKDPRLCRLLPFWKAVAAELGRVPRALLVIRAPGEIARSLEARDRFPDAKGLLLWCWHWLEAERESRGMGRAFVSYDALLEDPESTLARVFSQLGISARERHEDKRSLVSAFLDPALRHARTGGEARAPDWLLSLVKRVEEASLLAIEGQELGALQAAVDAGYATLVQKTSEAGDVARLWHEESMRLRLAERGRMTETHLKNLELERLNRHSLALEQELSRRNEELAAQGKSLERANTHLADLQRSPFWRIVAPFQALESLYSRFRRGWLDPRKYALLVPFLKSHGAKALWRHLITHPARPELPLLDASPVMAPSSSGPPSSYEHWIRENDVPTPEVSRVLLERQKDWPFKPKISIIMPVFNPGLEWLDKAIASVCAQTYANWELCVADDASEKEEVRTLLRGYQQREARIKLVFCESHGHISAASNRALALATGEFVALVDHDDLIPPHALHYVVEVLQEHPDARMIYSDEDKIDLEGKRFSPYFKPDFNLDLFHAQNFFSHLGVYRRDLVDKVGGFREGLEGSQDYDLALRCLERIPASQVIHIPRILYHWRAVPGSTAIGASEKGYASVAALRAVREHMTRQYPDREILVEPAVVEGCQRIRWPLPATRPFVSLIVPTRNQSAVLAQCIESILAKTAYGAFEILIVDNQTDEREALDYMARLVAQHPHIRVLRHDEPFNYSAINNEAVRQARGEILGLINNDTEVLTDPVEGRCWLGEMVSHALRPDVGAVGAKLFYPGGMVQHAGVLIGSGGNSRPVAGHLFAGLSRGDLGYFGRAMLAQELSAVTAACMILRKEVFLEAGGLNEEDLPVAFNDVDLCLSIRARGYRNVWTPQAKLIHHESLSRGSDALEENRPRALREVDFMHRKWGRTLTDDPFYNPNLNYARADFSLAFPSRVDW